MSKNQLHTDAKALWIESWTLSDSRERIIERLDRMGALYSDADIDFFEALIEERVFRLAAILMKLIVAKLTPTQRAPWSVMLGEFTFASAAEAAGQTAQCVHTKAKRMLKRLMKP